MPELTSVSKQETAGHVETSYNRAKRQARIEQDEKELEALLNGTSQDDEEESYSQSSEDTQVQTQSRTKQEEGLQTQAQEEDDDSDLSPEEKSFKKRYGDVRRHLAEKEKEYKARIAELEETLKSGPKHIRPPKTDEDIAAWARQYPDVASIVETIAAKKAKELFKNAEARFAELDRVKYEAERDKAENIIRKAHSDFDDLRNSDAFHTWAEEQPKWVQDALYENSDDPHSVIRVIDLYKVDNGKTPSDYRRKAKEVAKSVPKGQRTSLDSTGTDGVFRESQVARMSDREYAANAEAIDASIRSGKFIYDVSGGAR